MGARLSWLLAMSLGAGSCASPASGPSTTPRDPPASGPPSGPNAPGAEGTEAAGDATAIDGPTPAPERAAQSDAVDDPAMAEALALPSVRRYEGFIVCGLPTRETLDRALALGIDSALSLMDSSEPGIAEIAPYGASIGFRYLRFVIRGREDLSEAMAWEFAATLALLDSPAIIHDDTGERVAALFALKAFFVDELGADRALAIGTQLGMGSYADHVDSLIRDVPHE